MPTIKAGLRTVQATVTPTLVTDLNSQYGLDVVQRLEDVLVNELSESISQQIVRDLLDPFSHVNDPDGSKKRAYERRRDREQKLKRVFNE